MSVFGARGEIMETVRKGGSRVASGELTEHVPSVHTRSGVVARQQTCLLYLMLIEKRRR